MFSFFAFLCLIAFTYSCEVCDVENNYATCQKSSVCVYAENAEVPCTIRKIFSPEMIKNLYVHGPCGETILRYSFICNFNVSRVILQRNKQEYLCKNEIAVTHTTNHSSIMDPTDQALWSTNQIQITSSTSFYPDPSSNDVYTVPITQYISSSFGYVHSFNMDTQTSPTILNFSPNQPPTLNSDVIYTSTTAMTYLPTPLSHMDLVNLTHLPTPISMHWVNRTLTHPPTPTGLDLVNNSLAHLPTPTSSDVVNRSRSLSSMMSDSPTPFSILNDTTTLDHTTHHPIIQELSGNVDKAFGLAVTCLVLIILIILLWILKALKQRFFADIQFRSPAKRRRRRRALPRQDAPPPPGMSLHSLTSTDQGLEPKEEEDTVTEL